MLQLLGFGPRRRGCTQGVRSRFHKTVVMPGRFVNEASVDLHTSPLADYQNNNETMEYGGEKEEDGEAKVGDDGEAGDDGEVQEIDEEVFDGAVAKGKSARTMNYMEFEHVILIKAWESVSLDAITDIDQTSKRYWQRTEDKFFKLMRPLFSTPTCSYRSLQGCWNPIKNACS